MPEMIVKTTTVTDIRTTDQVGNRFGHIGASFVGDRHHFEMIMCNVYSYRGLRLNQFPGPRSFSLNRPPRCRVLALGMTLRFRSVRRQYRELSSSRPRTTAMRLWNCRRRRGSAAAGTRRRTCRRRGAR